MPLYDYQCKACGREFEITHSIKEDAREEIDHMNRQGLKCHGKLKPLLSPVTATWKDGAPTSKNYV